MLFKRGQTFIEFSDHKELTAHFRVFVPGINMNLSNERLPKKIMKRMRILLIKYKVSLALSTVFLMNPQ